MSTIQRDRIPTQSLPLKMATQLPPMHPYNVMLYRVSVFLKADLEKVLALGRIMGCRDIQNVNSPWMLFEILEEKECLSEFKVVHLQNSLDLIGLSEAAHVVKEYADKELQGESETTPSLPPPPRYSFIQRKVDETQMPVQETGSSEESEGTKPLSSHEGIDSNGDIPTTPMDTEKPKEPRGRFKPKYHTIAAPSMKIYKDRQSVLNGKEQTKNGI